MTFLFDDTMHQFMLSADDVTPQQVSKSQRMSLMIKQINLTLGFKMIIKAKPLILGSRDNQLGLWQINNSDDEPPTSPLSSLQVPEYNFKIPLLVKPCDDAKKVRALSYHSDRRVGSFMSYIWAASWQNQQNDCAQSEDSYRPGHPPSLISLCCVFIG